MGFPGGSAGKEPACNAGDLSWIPGFGRSPGEGKGYPLQYSGLENSMDCIVHRVPKSWTRLSDFHFPWCLPQRHEAELDQNWILQKHPFLTALGSGANFSMLETRYTCLFLVHCLRGFSPHPVLATGSGAPTSQSKEKAA